jgi:hypothetical protein
MNWPDFLTCEPILNWPGKGTPDWQRRRSQFRAPLTTTVKELRRELDYMNAIRPVLRVALRVGDIRQDGFPRANARPEHPGVVLVFGREARSKRFASRAAARNYLMGFARAAGIDRELDPNALYHIASKATHPDKGGDREDWEKVADAHRLLTQEDSYVLACDRFLDWEDNLRAITKTLESLRAVRRYEVVQDDEQYAGFKQLTSGRTA